jgi:hypothetical protein
MTLYVLIILCACAIRGNNNMGYTCIPRGTNAPLPKQSPVVYTQCRYRMPTGTQMLLQLSSSMQIDGDAAGAWHTRTWFS